MDDKDKFRELLELFVRTEKASPALLGLLEQRLIEAIGPEIDAEIVRHSLHVHSSRPRSAAADHVNCPLYKSNKRFLSEFRSTDSESSSHQTSGQPPLNSSSNTQHSLMVRHKIQGISNQLAQHSTKLRAFRAETLEECKQLVKSLWQIQQQKKDSQKVKKGGVSSGLFSPQRQLNGFSGFNTFSPHFLPPINFAGDERHKMDEAEYDDSDSEEEDEGQHNTMVELSSFSLDHSMQEWPDEEMQNIVWLICSDGMEQSVRLTNIQKLHFVSPFAFSKSKAFEIFLGHLHAILPLPLLFNETMHILARIMNCPNEMIWLKIVNCLSRVAHGVMRSSSLALSDKKCFADFFRQLLCYGPHIWRAFEQPNICRIVHDFVEMLTVEISAGGGGGPSPEGFLTILAQVDPEAQWLLSWLHRRSILTLMLPKFSEMINEILDHHGSDQLKGQCHLPRFWAFEASILFRCLQHSPVFAFLSEMVPDIAELRHSFCRAILHFLTLAFAPPIASGIRPKGFKMARRIMVKGLLETATSDCGAAVLSSIELFLGPLFAVPSSVGAPLFVQMPSPSSFSPPSFSPIFDLCLRVLLNVLLFAPSGFSLSGDVPSFLAKVEQSLRHHLTLFIHHNDNPFSNEITVQVLNALFEHFPLDQLRSAFSELIHSLLISNIAKLDHSKPNHRRLIVSIACLTFMDNNLSPYQWRKSVGKLLNKIALRNNSSIFSNGISPTNPHNQWATFPSTIELNETEKHLTTNALLHFLGLHQQRDERVPEKLARVHHQKPKSVQNGGAKKNSREIGRQSHHSAPFFSMPFGRFETEQSPKIVSSSDGNCSHKSIAEDAFLSIHCLDFLSSAPNDFRPATFHAEPLPDLVFFLVTQSELLVELLHLGKIGQYLLKEFTTFERLKDSGADQRMIEFFGKMGFMIINFDMLTELRHFVPNLGAKCVELLHKYCSDSSGNLLLSELSRTICLFLSHSFVASPSERRFGTFDRIGQMNAALANIPKSIYKKGKRRRKNGEEEKEEIADEENEEKREEEEGWEEEEEEEETERQSEGKGVRHQRMEEQKEPKALQKWDSSITPTEDGQPIDDFCKSEAADEQLKQQEEDHNHFGTITVFRKNSRTVSMQMEDKDFQFWFAVLPEKDTVATRHALLQNLFASETVDDGKMMNIRRMRSKPFELLNKFATKFWPMPEEKRMTIKPPQHSEWLSLLADYAHGLALMRGSRAAVRKRIGTLRLLQQQNGRAANDWFVAALFLSSGLSAEATSDLCDRLMEWRRIASVSSLSPCSVHTIWPMCCSISPPSAHRSFSELLALRVFPRVLSLLRLCPAFRPLRGFLLSCQLPSLFHLLLFYTNQAYLGILPFRAVQEYLVVAVFGGPEFQALHFCAVLAHIFHSSTPHNSLHFSSKLTSLFLRPIFLADFRFSKYAFFKTEENG